jgi:N-acetylneuraminic acid mutarotase
MVKGKKYMKTMMKLLLPAVLLGLFCKGLSFGQSSCADGTWSQVAPLSVPNGLPSAVGFNDLVYLVGGSNYSCGAYNSLNVYDPSTNAWTSRASMPTSRADAVVGVINGKIYAATGETGCGTFTNANEVYDPNTDSWTSKAPCPTAEYRATGGVLGGRLYVVAGNQGNYMDIYDPLTDTWSSGAPMPIARSDAASAVINGILYVIGGNGLSGYVSSVEAYDPLTNAWSEKAPLLVATGYLTGGATVLNGQIYVCGGGTNSGLSSTVYVYDPVLNSWSAVTSMPDARQSFGSASAGGKLFTVGGYTNAAGNYTTDVYSFTPNCTPTPYSARVQPPINADGTSVFTVRRGVVPVKFTLTQDGSPTCALPPATIVVTRTAGGTLGSVNESVYSGPSDSGSNFRIDSCQYIYNLNSSALGVGTYRIDILINAQVVGSGVFQLK